LFLGSFLLRDKDKAVYAYTAFSLAALIVGVWHILRIVLGSFFPTWGFFTAIASNTIGSWFDLGVFAGIGVVFSLISIEYLKVGKLVNLLKIVLVVSLVVIALIGYKDLWIILAIFSLILFIYLFTTNKYLFAGSKSKTPILSLVTMIVAIVFIIFGPQINAYLNSTFSINFVETQVSLGTTSDIVAKTIVDRPLFGVGPARFEQAWIDYRPLDFNLTSYWDTDFSFGFGLIMSLVVMSGLIGGLALLFFLIMYLYSGFRSIFKPLEDSLSRFILVSSFVVSLYLWIMSFIQIPSYVTLFLTFLFTAIFIGSLYREQISRVKEISIQNSPRAGFVYIFSLVLLIIVLILAGKNISEKFIASVIDRQVNPALSSGDLELAKDLLKKTIQLDKTDARFIKLSEIQQIETGRIMGDSNLSDTEKIRLFQQSLGEAIDSARAAIKYDVYNYRNYAFLGSIFSELIKVDIPGSLEQARKEFNKAIDLNPNSPGLPLVIAKAEFNAGEYEQAKQSIIQSLDLKSNYTDAVFLLSQINVAEGKLSEAIKNIESATYIKPNDPTVFFQLGMLYYQAERFSDAAGALAQSLKLAPNYANARYFFGLSLARMNRYKEATQQFEVLLETNPNNAEVQFILQNLRNDQSPFSNVEPPLDDEPENRDELPIEEEDE